MNQQVEDIFNYHIPQKWKNKMTNEFLNLFIKKLFFNDINAFEPLTEVIWDEKTDELIETNDIIRNQDGTIIFNEINWEGTGLWNDVLTEVCKETNNLDLLDYYNHLDWVKSDMFDDDLGNMLSRKIWRKEDLEV